MEELLLYSGMTVGMILLWCVLIIFDVILKGFAMWHAARKGQNVWFVFLLIINSIGILPIIYLIIHRKKKEHS